MRLMLVAAALTAAAGIAGAQSPAATKAVTLTDAKGKPAGTVTLTPAPKGVLLRVAATGLTPGWHGIHFHAVGDCSDGAAGFKKSGSHVHEAAQVVHGLLNPQANDEGDLTNIYAGPNGHANADLYSGLVTADKLMDADGSAIVIHAKPDDYSTQPIGGAGDRVACGVVK
jgi:superoxide dismutase, Cu-Zn family